MSLPLPFNLDGRVAVVTGAASGLGIEFSEAMAEAGADVVFSDVNEGACEETAERVHGLGRDVLAVRCDVSKEDDVKAMVERAVERYGRVDVLFNNAGTRRRGAGAASASTRPRTGIRSSTSTCTVSTTARASA